MNAANLHPEPVYKTNSGYTIYKSKLKGRNNGRNFCIGGSKNSLMSISNNSENDANPTKVLAHISKHGVEEGLRLLGIKIVSHLIVEPVDNEEVIREVDLSRKRKIDIDEYEERMMDPYYELNQPTNKAQRLDEDKSDAVMMDLDEGPEYDSNREVSCNPNFNNIGIGLLGVGSRIDE